MKTIKLFILASFLSVNAIFAQEDVTNNINHAETSNLELPRIQIIPIKDTKANRQYELYIKLPEGYSENNDTQYPVLYFTDGLWNIEVLSGTAEYVVEDAILVGISWEKEMKGGLKEHSSRFRDYSIIESSNPKKQAKYQFGQASNHLNFISNDIFKYVESNYRTDSDNRSYFGYSMGGKLGAYILLAQPETFKNYIIGSPALLMDKSYIHELESITALNRKEIHANVFVSIGALEDKAMIEQSKSLASYLKSRNHSRLSVHYEVIESANHNKAFPMTAVRSMYWLSGLIE